MAGQASAGPSSCTRRRRLPPSGPPSPSASLLSLLATLAGGVSAADGSPAPLPFLCPGYRPGIDSVHDTVVDKPLNILAASHVPRASARTDGLERKRLPIKYEANEDGMWRKAGSYTLIGSTMCPTCDGAPYPDSSYHAAATSTSSDAVSSLPITTDALGDILDTLPNGWRPGTREPKTTLIVMLSLVLAFVICFLIIGCLFWRKNIRRRFKGDIEMKPLPRRRRDASEEDEEVLTDTGVRRKMKLWARATARWKANARVRRRRGKRTAVASSSRTSLPPEPSTSDRLRGRDDSRSYVSQSRSSSGQSSRRSLHSADQVDSSSGSSVSLAGFAVHTPTTNPTPAPPAYHNPSRPNIHIDTTSGLAASSKSPSTPLSPCYRTSRRPSNSSAGHLSSDDLPYSPSAAHVATDDKAVLALLNQMASHPPQDTVHHQESSAPEWEDEELDDFESGPSAGESSLSTAFPPPPVPVPSTSKLASEYLEYGYSYSGFDEDIQGFEPELGPSAPPFEAVATATMATAPPLSEEPSLLPSASVIDELPGNVADAPEAEAPVVVSPPHYHS